jgi:protein-S-isoprenylcysteine O-methyltransferase Ste14
VSPPEAGRSRARLVVTAAAASLWFALVFFAAIPGLLLWAAGVPLRPDPGAPLWLGAALALLAQGVVVLHVADFVRVGHGTHAPLVPPQRLVQRGLYRWTRNPMYLLYGVVILGEALAWRSAVLLAYAAGFWLLTHLYVVGLEEKFLQRRFGGEYAAYCREVPRWLPRLRGGRARLEVAKGGRP